MQFMNLSYQFKVDKFLQHEKSSGIIYHQCTVNPPKSSCSNTKGKQSNSNLIYAFNFLNSWTSDWSEGDLLSCS